MRIISIIIFLLLYVQSYSQKLLKTSIDLTIHEATLLEVLEKIRQDEGINLAYSSKIIKSKKRFTFSAKNESLESVLALLFKHTDLKYSADDSQVIILKKKYYTIDGFVRDAETKEALTAAAVFHRQLGIGTYTNEYGYYSLSIPEGTQKVNFQYLGKQPKSRTIPLNQSQRLSIELESHISLSPIIVTQNLHSKGMVNQPLSQKSIIEFAESTPHIGGDPDLLHVLRAQSGVQSSPGGIGGLYVRGGNTGHNLVLLDGVPVYNWMHLIGLNSIFSPNAVRGVQFYTSGFSARHGGRLSSVIDIQSKEGDFEKWSGMFGVNQRSIQGSLSGRTFKGGSFWISGRTSTFVPYVRSVLSNTFFLDTDEEDGIVPTYSDFNLKFSQRLNSKNRLFFTLYNGNDEITGHGTTVNQDTVETIENRLSYGNRLWSLRWNHLYGEGKKLFSNATIHYSQFYNQFRQLNTTNEREFDFLYFNFQSFNNEISAKMDFDLYLKNHQIRFGFGGKAYISQPFFTIANQELYIFPDDSTAFDSLQITIDSFATPAQISPNVGFLFFAYLEDKITLSKKTELTAGLRYTSYIDIETIGKFVNLEPRFHLKHQFDEKWGSSLSVTRMVQHLHQISIADIGLPQDFWIPATKDYQPESAWQYNVDLQTTQFKNWNLTGALYYKRMNNLISFPNELDTVSFGNSLDKQFVTGQGLSYGAEFSAYFKNEKMDFFGAYTLSRSSRRFRSLNKGFWFPFQFDARHYLQIMANYKLNDHWSLGARGHFSTPRPRLVSLFASLEYGLSRIDIDQLGQKNQTRGKYENRIDLNINRIWRTNKDKIQHRATFEIYNIYNKKNPVFSYQLDQGHSSYIPGLNMPFMVSVNYTMQF